MSSPTRLIRLATALGLSLAALWLATPFASAQPAPCDPATACLDASLVTPGLVGDFYLNGALSAATVNSARLAAAPGAAAIVEVRNIQEPGAAGFGDLYVYPDQSQSLATAVAGQIRALTFRPVKSFVKGALTYTCQPRGFKAADSVACRPTVDGATQPDVAPGAAATFNLPAGPHALHTDLVGDQAVNWNTSARDDTVTIKAGTSTLQATRFTADFTLKGLLNISLAPGLTADLYLDGALIAPQAATASVYVVTGAPHTVEARAIQDPATPGFNDLFVYPDQIQANLTLTPGAARAVVFRPIKSYVKGALSYACQPRGFKATDIIACRVTIDGAPQPDVAPNATIAFNLPAGPHAVHTELVGDQANNWSPTARDDTMTVNAGRSTLQTTALKAAFQLKGLLKIALSPAGLLADLYVDGVLISAQAASADVYVAAGAHSVQASLVTDPAANGVYRYNDVSLAATATANVTRPVTLLPKKEFLLGFAVVTCRINGLEAGQDVRCSLAADGTPLGSLEAGQKQTYNLTPGAHTLNMSVVGGSAGLWAPPAQDLPITITGGRTSPLTATFNRKGLLNLALSAPGVVADLYVDGVLVAGQAATAQWAVEPNRPHVVAALNLTNTAAPDAFAYDPLAQTVTVGANQTRNLTLTVGKARERCTGGMALVRFVNLLDNALTRKFVGPENFTFLQLSRAETWLCILPGNYVETDVAAHYLTTDQLVSVAADAGCYYALVYPQDAVPGDDQKFCSLNIGDYHRP